jgi:hypothetical protein
MKRPLLVLLCLSLSFIASPVLARQDMLATIESDIVTPFATYHPVQFDVTPQVPDFVLSPDLHEVCNLAATQRHFTARDSTLIFENHFTVKWPLIYYSAGYGGYLTGAPKQMHHIYNDATHYDTPIFITSDAVLHIYHTMFDLALARIEQEKLFPTLISFVDALTDDSLIDLYTSSDDLAKDAGSVALVYLWVAKSLLSVNSVSPPAHVADFVAQELALIEAHQGFTASPTFSETEPDFNLTKVDYSQFIPRGHYTRTEELKRYFKAMMWFGLVPLRSNSDRNTMAALILTQAAQKASGAGTAAMDLWMRIYDPTIFFVGKSDDPNMRDYISVATDIYGEDYANLPPEALTDETKLAAFKLAATEVVVPQIPFYDPDTGIPVVGFRLMGQRFIPDSYMFGALVFPYIEGRREFPLGLDVMAILGSDLAADLLDEVYDETRWKGYVERRDELSIEFQSLPTDTWGQNLYWNWLYSLMPLLNEKPDGYPQFMQNDAWAKKDLNSALGSWAELRHDTILYAKQSMGGIGCDPPGPPQSYVEPNPHLYARLLALTRFTREGLGSRDLLLNGMSEQLELFDTLLEFLLNVSIKELENVPLTDDEYANLYSFGEVMQQLTEPGGDDPLVDTEMAIIADVHTGVETMQALEEAVGYPLEIWVVVNEGDHTRITRGAIFSYYEFKWPMNDRLTDEKWREMLDRHDEPDMPVWVSQLMDTEAERPGYTNEKPSSIWSHEFDPTSVSASPEQVKLHPNRPNPFNPETFVRFELPRLEHVRVDIYDALGRHVLTLADRAYQPGDHTLVWKGTDRHGRDVSSGVYVLRMVAGDQVRTRRMTLLR